MLLLSLLFYSLADLAGLPLVLASILFNYWLSGHIRTVSAHRQWWVTAGVALNLLPLLFFKYLQGPAPVSSAGLFVVAGIPLGLSFYTFQQITCLFDMQRPDAVRLSFVRHALFAGFFAQVPAGPVSKYRNLAPQMARLGCDRVEFSTVLAGASLFLIGLAKKTLIADPLGDLVNGFHALVAHGQHLSFVEAWFTAWTFLLQMYFDFSGYSDMAIGVALCFGITLPVNFNSPLQAISGSEFVGRWHMSLVGWIREYLYQPLFDAVRRLPIPSRQLKRVVAWAVATIASMTVIGIWHGRQLALLVEGFLGGTLLVIAQLPALLRKPHTPSPPNSHRLHLFRRARVLAVVSVLALALRAGSTTALLQILHSMVDLRSLKPAATFSAATAFAQFHTMPHSTMNPADWFIFVLANIVVFGLPNTMRIFHLLPETHSAETTSGFALNRWRPNFGWGLAVGTLALLELVFSATRGEKFIYAAF
ncbi:MAG: MBOAT family O-acyltransferase [Janthinobacterium lividum]